MKFKKKADAMAQATTDGYASGQVAIQSDPFYMVEDEWLQSAAKDVKELKEQDSEESSPLQREQESWDKLANYWNNFSEENLDIVTDKLDIIIDEIQQQLEDKDAWPKEYTIAKKELIYHLAWYINNNFYIPNRGSQKPKGQSDDIEKLDIEI